MSIPSAITPHEADVLAVLAGGKVVLELGSQFGQSTVALARFAARVHAVDWHLGDAQAGERDTLSEFVRNLEAFGVREKVVVHVGRFADVLPLLKDHSFGLVFIDGEHGAEAVRRDIEHAERLLHRGGILVLHDYERPTLPDVKRVAEEVLGKTQEVYDSLGVWR